MFVDLLAVAGYLSGIYTIPQEGISGLALSMDGGSCSAGSPSVPSPAASLSWSWSLANPDASLFDIKVYENGSLVTTLAGDATAWVHSMDPYVVGGPFYEFRYLATWRFDVVRKSDGTAISSATSDPIDVFLGYCE